jgi:hypothetical protein
MEGSRVGIVAVAFLAVPLFALSAEAAQAPARQTVVAGAQYKVGGFTRLWVGEDYRKLWTTPISVEVLDLQKEAGGLRPVRRVGGQQTKGLALSGADGRSYTFRGLEKDASHLLDEVDPDLKDTIVAKMLDLLMAAQHPASELVARGILDAAGIPCPNWRLVVLPDDPALGEFREDFKGAVGVFAVYPTPATGAVPGFIGATEVIDHAEMYERLHAGAGDTIDAQALLKARLVDILMGDWDRHRKQWRWAKVPGNAGWLPIPEDRDQAFSRYEGLALSMGRGTDPRFQNFGPKFSGPVGGLTFNGAEQDRQLLVQFSREDFVAAAKALQAQLTNEAIDKAVRLMPAEWYAIDGARLTHDLEARRELLPDEAVKYHAHLSAVVDVRLTNKTEQIEADRRANGDTEVTVHVVGSDGKPGPPTFHRVFDAKETHEIRFYTYDGNDTVKVTGGHDGPKVRMIGGNGDDTLDAAGSDNAKLSDSDGTNHAIDAADDSRPYEPPPPPKNAPWIPPRDWTRETVGVPWISYNGDLGVFLGYGFETHDFGFRKSPFASSHQVRAGYAFNAKNGKVDYTGEFHRENKASYFGLYAFASGVEVLRFYGFGNETQATAGDKNYYKANAGQLLLYPSFHLPFGKRGTFTIGPAMKYTDSNEAKDQFINLAQPYGWGKFGEVGVHTVLSWEGRDNQEFPRRGFFAAARGSWWAKAWDVDSDFGEVNGNLNGYFSAGRVATLALRVGGKKVFGTYPYMDGAVIGEGGLGVGALQEPTDTVRGYRARRYLGDASLWGNSDLRLRVSHITLVLPGEWGINGFADAGRVWLAGESSQKWHPGFGGGLWLSLLRDRMGFSVGIAHSVEDDIVYFKGGFSY